MIRIDEIYNHTFWPWVRDHVPGVRLFFCDPPGRSDPDALFNFGFDDILETNYIFMHDQEPIHLDLHDRLFDTVVERSGDISYRLFGTKQGMTYEQWLATYLNKQIPFGHVVVSEKGEFVEELCSRYRWTPHYYFFHGWACQDWFRGYDKSFLIARARDRQPTKTFISPNRIIGGKRDHRVLFLYNVFKHSLDHNWISAPRQCVYEDTSINEIAKKYCNIYPDIDQVFDAAPLPKMFPGESTQEMSSCWLTNFDQAADSLFYVPTETVYFGRRLHITEKTFKAIALEMPFVLVAPVGSLEYLRSYGFRTFGSVIDETYDEETDDIKRIEKVVKLLKDLDDLSTREKIQIHRACVPAVEHNYHHFYNGGLTDVLWQELLGMLDGIKSQLCGRS